MKSTRLSYLENGSITGPMSPMFAFSTIGKAIQEQPLALYRVDFTDTDFQLDEGKTSPTYLPGATLAGFGRDKTYHDTLVICFKNSCCLIVDEGIQLATIAAYIYGDKEVTLLKGYERGWLTKPDPEDLYHLLQDIYLKFKEYFQKEFIPEYKKWKNNASIQTTG